MELVDPFIEDAEEHYRIRIAIVVVVALQLRQVYLVHEGASVRTEDRP
jgi:hypothetical protein